MSGSVDISSETRSVVQPKPILRPVGPEEAARLSPWPDRVAGLVAWKKPERSQEQIQAEYEGGWYAHLLEEWGAFHERLRPRDRHPGAAMSFFDDLRRKNNDVLKNSPEVYGNVDLEAFLLSVGDRLYAGDLNLFEALFRAFVVERVAQARSQRPFETVVEIGCGSGVNLFTLYNRLSLTSIAGSDLSKSAVRFLRQMSGDLAIQAQFEPGDYRDVDSIRGLVPVAGPWSLLSVHTIEQATDLPATWFEAIIDLPNPPQIVMHFEPLHWPDDTPFARACERYAELNHYNQSFLREVETAEKNGWIRVVWSERRVIGHSAYNPTSVLMWVPARERLSGRESSSLD